VKFVGNKLIYVYNLHGRSTILNYLSYRGIENYCADINISHCYTKSNDKIWHWLVSCSTWLGFKFYFFWFFSHLSVVLQSASFRWDYRMTPVCSIPNPYWYVVRSTQLLLFDFVPQITLGGRCLICANTLSHFDSWTSTSQKTLAVLTTVKRYSTKVVIVWSLEQ
jgi:hypothetical protein